MASIIIDGASHRAEPGERLVDVINRIGTKIPQVCYHPQLGPIQTCDTCIVEVNGKLARACGKMVAGGMSVLTTSSEASEAQREAFDRILGNHLCGTAANRSASRAAFLAAIV